MPGEFFAPNLRSRIRIISRLDSIYEVMIRRTENSIFPDFYFPDASSLSQACLSAPPVFWGFSVSSSGQTVRNIGTFIHRSASSTQDHLSNTTCARNDDSSIVPDKYLCAIDYEVMVDPVYDPRHPQVFYSRNNIARWLVNDGDFKNPFTREDLSPTQLKPANILEIEIEEFVSKARTENKADRSKSVSVDCLLKNHSLFTNLHNDLLIDKRHDSEETQKEYDRRYGLILR